MQMQRRELGGRVGVVILALALACSIAPSALAAPQAARTSPPTAFVGAPIQKFGVVSNIATRFAKLGHFKEPMDVLQRMGAGVISEQVKWDYVEQPKCGQYSWDYYDELTKEARAHQLEIMGQFAYNNIACQVGKEDRGVPDPARWKNFITAFVSRYKGDIHKWEVWNEPDDSDFWQGTPQQYVSLLRDTYETIKALDPTAQVSAGACSKLDYKVCDAIIAAGSQKYSDSFGFHPYVGKDNFDNGLFQKLDLPQLLNHQKQSGGKPVRLTEFGWSSGNPSFGGNAVGEAQGSYMVKQLVSMLGFTDLTIDQVMWYDFRDDGPATSAQSPFHYFAYKVDDDPESRFGLVQSDWLTPKPSYFAYQQMSLHLAGALAQGLTDRGDGGRAYRFNRNGTVVDVVWGGGATNLATESREAQAYTLSGQPVATTVSDGQIHIAVGDDPVYIEHSKSAYGSSASLPPSPTGSSNASAPAPGGTGVGSTTTVNSVAPPAASSVASATTGSNGIAPTPGNPPIFFAGGAMNTWTDPEKRLRLQFPGGWNVTRLPGTAQNLLELDGPDGVLFFVDLFDQTATPDAIIDAAKQIHRQSTVYTYTDTTALAVTVGGEPGVTLNFTYTSPDAATIPTRTGRLWVVNHGGKEFDFQVRNQGGHASDVDGIVASVVFLR